MSIDNTTVNINNIDTDTLIQNDLFNNNMTERTNSMNNLVDLLDLVANESMESRLDVVRLGSDETAIIPFTSKSVSIDLHYCQETEINGYVACNGPGCVLCRIGRKKDTRQLLPVYLPAAGHIATLPVSKSLSPYALLPQISNVLKTKKTMVMFVTREGAKYNVTTNELQRDIDCGETVILQFLEDYEAGLHDLTAVYPRIDNEQLANVGEISRMMALKGVKCQ